LDYEYYWDGNNENGSKVAPGIYLYRVKMDKETRQARWHHQIETIIEGRSTRGRNLLIFLS